MSYINQVNDNGFIYSFKLRDFIEKQGKIADKYMDKLSNNTDMEIIDKYILQILEEVWEAKTAKSHGEFVDEILDVAMYTGSFYSVFNKLSESDLESVDERIYFTVSERSINTISDDLINLRRLYPERKWHKNEKIPVGKNERFEISKKILLSILETCIIIATDYDEEEANEYLSIKQDYILYL